jgi:trehalose synthase
VSVSPLVRSPAVARPARVPVRALAVEPLRAELPPSGRARLDRVEAAAPGLLDGRRLWCVSSTACGGGVAELLRSLVGYATGMGIDARWMVLDGDSAFFRFTKRLHELLHGVATNGSPSPFECAVYDQVTAANARRLVRRVQPGDVAVLHDPQTAGLAGALKDCGATVLWRCHVGTEQQSAAAEAAWEVLLPRLEPVDAFVFTGAWAVPRQLTGRPVHLIAPSIDPRAPKNVRLTSAVAERLLRSVGLEFAIDRQLVLHVARWDRLKDPVGVVDMFERHILPQADARLIVAGPPADFVTDDPSAITEHHAVQRRWAALPRRVRDKVHVVCLPQYDRRENALIVNALQRQAAVVVKKSLAEGFGLGATEAMWKERAVVAAAVGGLRDQIEHASSGILIQDPSDLESFGAAVVELLADPGRRALLGAAGRRRVTQHYLHDRHLADWAALLTSVLQPAAGAAAAAGG